MPPPPCSPSSRSPLPFRLTVSSPLLLVTAAGGARSAGEAMLAVLPTPTLRSWHPMFPIWRGTDAATSIGAMVHGVVVVVLGSIGTPAA
uniref:Predicted protein n=1 Tax=Hordeum vulgare subsp. vulgare TaxID=112509 RepID=F2E770_HORVV|nr:predicted protein [Hordeum vulgare subsp. vulgare]